MPTDINTDQTNSFQLSIYKLVSKISNEGSTVNLFYNDQQIN